MASTLTKKHARRARVTRTPKRAVQRVGDLTMDELNAIIQTTIRQNLELVPSYSLNQTRRTHLAARARRAEGNWKKTEPQGTAIEVVRKLRAEWA